MPDIDLSNLFICYLLECPFIFKCMHSFYCRVKQDPWQEGIIYFRFFSTFSPSEGYRKQDPIVQLNRAVQF